MDTFDESGGFLSSVLACHAEAEMDSFRDMITDVGEKILNLKFQVKEMIQETYIDFSQLPQEHKQMVSEAKKLSSQVNELSDKIENKIKRNLRNSTSELENLSACLQEITLTTTIVNQLVELDLTFKSATKLQDEKKYSDMAKVLRRTQELLAESSQHNKDLEIFKALAQESSHIGGNFLEDMMTVWGDCLKYKEVQSPSSANVTYFSMLVDVHRSKEISQMLQALNYFDHLDMYFEKFAIRFFKSMILPNILQDSKVTTEVQGKFVLLNVQINSSLQKNAYEVVYGNLYQIFDFVHMHLNIDIGENFTFINKLGEIISESLIESLIKNCLADTIPSHSNQLDNYNTVIQATNKFQTYLKSIGLLQEADVMLEDYTKNVEYLCANKTCQSLLEKARILMKKDLYDMMEVGHVKSDQAPKGVKEETNIELKPKIKLTSNMFEFPRCQISKSANELLTLINQVIIDCTTSTDTCAVRLFYTARNIVELYCAVVPTYHQKFLETIPQQVALFHNNCMYLSHCLLTLGHTHRPLLPQVLQAHTTTFVDQVTELRTIGTSIFLKHMQLQRNQIFDIVRNSGLATLRESASLTPTTEKAIRQSLRQLELLQTVWQKVLPENVYCKAVGCLLNSLVDDLIGRVVSVEDMRADTATNLVVLFNVVIARGPQIFPDPKVVHRYVSKWAKFLELVLILGASMKDIVDRWANGKGPTALHFQAEQVKQLIRALFQNTERRSAVLAQIK